MAADASSSLLSSLVGFVAAATAATTISSSAVYFQNSDNINYVLLRRGGMDDLDRVRVQRICWLFFLLCFVDVIK